MFIIGTSNSDQLQGTPEADTLDGGLGADTLAGGLGDDVYVVDHVDDLVIENAGEGTDLVLSSVAFALPSHLENLTLTGTALTGAGNGGDNLLKANDLFREKQPYPGLWEGPPTTYDVYAGSHLQAGAGNDTLIGSRGVDTLEGGTGDDVYDIRYVYLNGNFTAAQIDEHAGEGVDEVRYSGPTYTLPANVENLTMVGPGGGGGNGNGLDNVLKSETTVNRLYGMAGRDTLWGGAGPDTLSGGLGNDVITGGAGADVILFAKGDGQDIVHADGLDTLVLGEGLSRSDLRIGRLGAMAADTVVLGFKNNTDTITLDQAGQWGGLILRFADGSSLSGDQVMAEAIKPEPPKPIDLTLAGTSGKDRLTGQDGNDTLSGLAGNDTLAGGEGDDWLIGGKGADAYLFNPGDGHDTIVENDTSLLNTLLSPDVLKIGSAKSNQLWLTRSGNNLDIAIIGTADKVTIQDWYKGSANQVEKITASGDNKTLTAARVNALVGAMAKFSAPAEGVTTLPAATQTALAKILASSWA